MTRFAKDRRVIVWEEPLFASPERTPRLDMNVDAESGVVVLTPVLPQGARADDHPAMLKRLLDTVVAGIEGDVIRWYDTPMMLPFSRHLEAVCTVYDCIDELATCKSAPPELTRLERELMGVADIVFTAGHSLWEAKRDRHPNIHPFPSSVDRAHFAKARVLRGEPKDQARIVWPRFGYYGVVDERMDLGLLEALADAGWDVALMPFAVGESTRFISPTVTPEYLAGGRPVVSTPIADVARQYGKLAAVKIAATREAFVAACDEALALSRLKGPWLTAVDAALAATSWDETFERMNLEISHVLSGRFRPATSPRAAPAAPLTSRLGKRVLH